MSPAKCPAAHPVDGAPGHLNCGIELDRNEAVMSNRFEARTAIATGASRGIGRAIAGRLVADGARVAAWMTGQLLHVNGGATITGGGE